MGDISKTLLNSRRGIGNFREYWKIPSFSIPIVAVFIVVVFLVDIPKSHQNWIELMIRGPNLIECDQIGVKTT